MRVVPSSEMPGRCSWPLSRQRVGFRHERTKIAAAGEDRSVQSVKRTIKSGNAEHEAECRAASERCDSRPGRCESPVEQHARESPEWLLLPRQRTAQSRKHAINGVGIGGGSTPPFRGLAEKLGISRPC